MSNPSPKRIAGMMITDMQADQDALQKVNRMLSAALVMAINAIQEQVEKPVILTLTPEGQTAVQNDWVLDIAISKDEKTFTFQTKAVDKSKLRDEPSIILPPGAALN